MANKNVLFTTFPSELTDDQLLDLADIDQEGGYCCQDVILLNHGFWLPTDVVFQERQQHYLNLFERVTSPEDDSDE